MENKFRLNDTEDSLIIDDNYKTKITFLTILLVINAITSFIILYTTDFDFSEVITLIHAFIGTISLITLIWFWINRVIDNQIAFKDISLLKTRNIFGSPRYTIVLINGKCRDINLDRKNYFNEFETLKELFAQKDIPDY